MLADCTTPERYRRTLAGVLLYHWWNGRWGRWHRQDVWLEELPDGRWLVRWRGDDWTDREGRHVYTEPDEVIAALRELLGEDQAGWKTLPTGRGI